MGSVFDGRTTVMQRRAVNTRGDIRQDQYGNFTITKSLPDLTELAMNRKLYSASTAAGTAKAPYAAIPTTTATWALYNGGTGNSQLVVIRIWAWLISGVRGIGEVIFAGTSSAAQGTALTAYSASVNKAVTPGSAATTAVFANAATLAGAPAWQVWAANGGGSIDISDSSGMSADVYGFYVVPPTYALGAGIYNIGGTSALYGLGFDYAIIEMELP